MTEGQTAVAAIQRFDTGFDTPEATVLGAIKNDGICILENALSKDETAELRDEVYAIAMRPPVWLKNHPLDKGFSFSFSPLLASRYNEATKIARMAAAFEHSVLAKTCRELLGPMWYFDRIIIELKPASSEPITDWHADQFFRHGRCVKCMLYLGDTDSDGGAFSYVPGSHHLMRAILDNHSGEQAGLRHIETIRDMAKDLVVRQPRLTSMVEALLADMNGHIASALVSDDHYSVSGPAGSAIIFDATGVHRGGVPRTRERLIVRSHSRNFQLNEVFRSKSNAVLAAQRLFYRATQPTGAALV